MMKKSYLNNLNKMLDDENVAGKKLIKSIIQLNEVKAKFNVGDVVIFTANGNYIWNTPVKNCIGTVSEVRKNWRDELIVYQITADFSNGKKNHSTYYYVTEEMVKKSNSKNLLNKIGTDSDNADSIEVGLPR